MGDPSKHHYVPQFYMRWWAGSDGRLERYDRPFAGKIMVRRVPPSEVGFKRDLYSSRGEAEQRKNWLETQTLQVIDSRASKVLAKLNMSIVPRLTVDEMSYWSVFIRSLCHRTPKMMTDFKNQGRVEWIEAVEAAREEYPRLKGQNDPDTFEEYRGMHTDEQVERMVLRVLPDILYYERVGVFLNNLYKRTFESPKGAPDFLISDAMLAMTNGLQTAGGHYAIPLSPRRMLLAAYEQDTIRWATDTDAKALVKIMNIWTVGRARHFVAATDRSQDRFIRNHFGENVPSND